MSRRALMWASEPEKEAWMLEHAAAPATVADVIDGFEREFGVRLKGPQVSYFRASRGLDRRRGNRTAHRKDVPPVGAERVDRGYTMVKVAELPTRPQSRDNWRLKHVVEWERANGRPLPEDSCVVFANRDTRDFSPENLVAVPRRLMGALNGGPGWSDRETLEAAVALAELKVAANDAAFPPRRCGVCGREFAPDFRNYRTGLCQATCRECLAKGLRAEKAAREYPRTCPVCGKGFTGRSAIAAYCSVKCRNKAAYRRRKEKVDER